MDEQRKPLFHRVEDGRTGPWLRTHHARDPRTAVREYDHRCARCREDFATASGPFRFGASSHRSLDVALGRVGAAR